jgi:hypothetical protein
MIFVIPLLVLGIVLLFPFVGCMGEDPDLAYDRGKREAAEQAAEEQKKKEEVEKIQEEEAKKTALYESIVSAEGGLRSYWRLSEGEVGNASAPDSAPDVPIINGTYMNIGGGGVTRGADGVLAVAGQRLDKCAEFDGVKGYVEAGHDGSLNPQLDFSVELWCRPDSAALATQRQVLIGSYVVDGAGNVLRGYVIDIFTNAAGQRVRGRVGNGSGHTAIDASLEAGSEHDAWRHIVLTYSAVLKELHLYVNSDSGVPDATMPKPPAAGDPPVPLVFYAENQTNPLRIAAGQVETPPTSTAPSLFFKGRIDEVAVYGIPLDGGQVKTHFQRATALVGP